MWNWNNSGLTAVIVSYRTAVHSELSLKWNTIPLFVPEPPRPKSTTSPLTTAVNNDPPPSKLGCRWFPLPFFVFLGSFCCSLRTLSLGVIYFKDWWVIKVLIRRILFWNFVRLIAAISDEYMILFVFNMF